MICCKNLTQDPLTYFMKKLLGYGFILSSLLLIFGCKSKDSNEQAANSQLMSYTLDRENVRYTGDNCLVYDMVDPFSDWTYVMACHSDPQRPAEGVTFAFLVYAEDATYAVAFRGDGLRQHVLNDTSGLWLDMRLDKGDIIELLWSTDKGLDWAYMEDDISEFNQALDLIANGSRLVARTTLGTEPMANDSLFLSGSYAAIAEFRK